MKHYLVLISCLFFISCLRLDDNLFNESKLDKYRLDDYSGEVDFILDDTYKIPDNLIHLFTLSSKDASEAASTLIYAIYIGDLSRIGTDTVIMYCHGNRDHMDFYWQRAKLLANAGYKNRFGVLMIDYRGFGMSEGNCSETGLYADVNAAMTWLKSQGLTDDRLVIYGFSLGSAPATKMCAFNYAMKPAKLMLEAPYASAELMAQDASKLALPGRFVTDLEIKNGEWIKSVQQPLYWIHGVDDDYISAETQGNVVYGNHHGVYKEKHLIPDADHGNIEPVMGYGNYLKTVVDFIEWQ